MSRKGKVDSIRTKNGQFVPLIRDDIAYLVVEINALKKFQDFIPFTEKSAEGISILDMFCEIDRFQCELYDAVINDRNNSYKTVKVSVNTDQPAKVLDRLIVNREQMVKLLNGIPEEEWGQNIEIGTGKASLSTLMKEMVAEERLVLKKISEQLMAIKS